MNWEQESGGTRFPGCEHARQGDQLPDSLPWRGKRGDGGSGVLWGLDFPSCHCFPFISVRHTHTHCTHTHTRCGPAPATGESLSWGWTGRAGGCPFCLWAQKAGVVLCLGTQCHAGGGDLGVGLLATAAGAAHSPIQPAVGLEGRGAQFVASRQVQERGAGKAERRRRGWQWGRGRGRGQRVEVWGGVPGVTQGGAPVAGGQARWAGGQRQEAGGPGHGQQPAVLQQPQDTGGGEGLGRRGGRPLLQVSALVFLLLGAAVLEPDLHLGAERGEGSRRGRGDRE